MNKLKIHFLNTIWSDAILLEKDNNFAFVDTGSSFYYPMIQNYLDQNNIEVIDFIILTHFHSDHYGNVSKLLNEYKVNKLYIKHYYGLDGSTASGYTSNEEYIEHEMMKYNEIIFACKNNNTEIIFLDDFDSSVINIDFNGISLEAYDCINTLYNLYNNIDSSVYHKKAFNENYNSIGLFIKVNDYNIFLGGDITCSQSDISEVNKRSINIIKDIYRKHNIDHIDIYKSCHHGGSGTNTKELCDLLKANYTIITNTDRWLNTYSTYDNLKNANNSAIILKTDHQKYIFEISECINYKKIDEESLFIILNKN